MGLFCSMTVKARPGSSDLRFPSINIIILYKYHTNNNLVIPPCSFSTSSEQHEVYFLALRQSSAFGESSFQRDRNMFWLPGDFSAVPVCVVLTAPFVAGVCFYCTSMHSAVFLNPVPLVTIIRSNLMSSHDNPWTIIE